MPKPIKLLILLLPCFLASCLLLNSTYAQYTNAGAQLGVTPVLSGSVIFGNATSIHDIDGDGLDDLSFGTNSTQPLIYRNTGSGFEQIPFNHPSPNLSIKTILWVDIDNDGDKDLFISYENGPMRLYENVGDLELVDITESAGLPSMSSIRYTGASFADYDNDGYLDFYICKFYNSALVAGATYENELYRNNGDNTFTNVTQPSGINIGVKASFQGTWFDYNYDGHIDLFVVNDRIFNENYLMRNNGDGTFTDVSAEAGINYAIDAMGCALGDYNNDLLLDFFVANSQFMGNHLYQQQPDFNFVNVAPEAGVETFQLCWSGLWMDYNNNGFIDLHVGTEFITFNQFERNAFYINNGDGTFSEAGVALGLGLDHFSSFSSAHGDWNNDGYSDFIVSSAPPHACQVWENIGGANHYLGVTLEGVISNRDAIGAYMYCYANGMQQMRIMACGENYLAQNSQRKLFGLEQADLVDSLVVKWPSGHSDIYYNLAVNQTHHFIEGSSLLAPISSNDQIICFNNPVTLTAETSNDVVWSNGATGVHELVVATPGSYSYVYTTALGLIAYSDTIEVVGYPFALPELDWTHPTCAGLDNGSISLNQGFADEGIEVLLNGLPAGFMNEGLAAGMYELVIGDAFGCTSTFEVTLTDNAAVQALSLLGDIACHGETTTAEVFVFGGTPPYQITWLNNADPSALGAGVHEFSVTDANGCQGSFVAEVDQPQLLSSNIVQQAPNLLASAEGGTPPYTFNWEADNGSALSGILITPTENGAYTLSVTDANGCLSTNFIEVDFVVSVPQLSAKRFTLFPNPTIDLLHIECSNTMIDHITLASAQGTVVAMHQNQQHSSTMSVSTSHLAAGSYVVNVRFSDGSYNTARVIIVK